MIVLHGIWKPPEASTDRGDFFLWGESSFISPVKRRGRPRKSNASHPYQASEKDLKIAKIILIRKWAGITKRSAGVQWKLRMGNRRKQGKVRKNHEVVAMGL